MKVLFLSLPLALLTLSCGPAASNKRSSVALSKVVSTTVSQERGATTTPHNINDTAVCVLYPKRQEPKRGNALTRERLHELQLSICDYDIPIYGDVVEIWNGDKANNSGFGIGFDESGNISYEMYSSDFISDSTDEYRRNYTYDTVGRLIGQQAWCYNGHIKQELEAKYDSRGNVIEMNSWASLWRTGRTSYKYDSRGNITEIDHSNGDRTIYKYDSHSNKIMALIYNNGQRVGKRTYKYDANDNLVISLNYDCSDYLLNKHLYYYNSEGDMCKVVTYSNNKECDVKIVSEIEYDSRGNLIKCGQEILHTITYSK